jgi:hypothetical protein
MKQLEQDVIGAMRAAIAHVDTDLAVVKENRYKAHELFAEHLLEWSETFSTLYSAMLEIFNAHTPKEKGHYRTIHIGIGYSSFPVCRWIADKEPPPQPTAGELCERFDLLIRAWKGSEEAA